MPATIIQPTQTMLKLFGYLVTYSESRWYRRWRYATYAFTWNLLLPMSFYGAANYADLAILAETISLAAGEWNAMAKGAVLLANLPVLSAMLAALQRNVDEKERLGRQRHYRTMDARATLLSRIVFGWMFSSIASIALGPLLLMLYHKVAVGDLTRSMYRQPVEMRLPYDYTAWPAFELTYVACIFTIICTGNTMVIVDCLFLGLCSHIIACQRDLQDMLAELGGAGRFGGGWTGNAAGGRRRRRGRNHPDRGELIVGDESWRLERRLRECVRFHYEILTHVADLAAAYSGAVFTQFVLSVVQMGTLAFQIQQGQDITIDRHIANGITSIVALMELLIYCYFGNAVTAEGERVADAAYAAPWYRCAPRLRRRLLLVQMRAQQPDFFEGFKVVVCTLESYTSVLNMVGSTLALLQSVV